MHMNRFMKLLLAGVILSTAACDGFGGGTTAEPPTGRATVLVQGTGTVESIKLSAGVEQPDVERSEDGGDDMYLCAERYENLLLVDRSLANIDANTGEKGVRGEANDKLNMGIFTGTATRIRQDAFRDTFSVELRDIRSGAIIRGSVSAGTFDCGLHESLGTGLVFTWDSYDYVGGEIS